MTNSTNQNSTYREVFHSRLKRSTILSSDPKVKAQSRSLET